MKNLKALLTLSILLLAPAAQAAKLVRKDAPTSPITSKIDVLHLQYSHEFDRGSQFSWSATFDIESRKSTEKWGSTIKQAVHQALSKPDDYTAPDSVTVEKPYFLSSRFKKAKFAAIISHGFNTDFVFEQIQCEREDEVLETFERFTTDAATELKELAMEDNRILVVQGEEQGDFGSSQFVALVDLDAGEIHLFGLGYAE
jgi:hypothetical protein